jgi:hypothetical protein
MDRIERLLRAAGWSPGRRVDTSGAEQALINAGFPITPAALAALREFSGLTIQGPNPANNVTINGEQIVLSVFPSWFDRYNEAEGHTFTPIGENGPMVVMIDETGSVWGAFDDEYGRIGDTVPEAVYDMLFPNPTRPGLDRHLTLDAEHFSYLGRVRAAGRQQRAQRGWWKHTGGR